ncbi:MAG: DUF2235 domain-containing protein [Methylococcales bacterium]|jgi:hypothetical protein|nr:DUF2235 domain-containing protein [Methylococcales bacterium]MBT7443409.1 DUF2235 domain-containing protein [Methylococcales bacterium]
MINEKSTISIYFDGTGNSRQNDQRHGSHSNVARLYNADKAVKSDLSYNVNKPKSYNSKALPGQPSEAVYFDGVGSQKDEKIDSISDAFSAIRKGLEGGTGLGGDKRIDAAYDAVVSYHNKYPGKEVDVNIVGFSRGAAQARALSNKIIDDGIPDTSKNAKSEYLIKPGKPKIKNMTIFDTVASMGIPQIHTHLGKELSIHQNVENTTHLVALNEYRHTFPLTSAISNQNKNITEVQFVGAHSQIGGGYKNDVLAAGPLAYAYKQLKESGVVELAPLKKEDRARINNYNKIIKNPAAVKDALIDSRIDENGKTFVLEKSQDYKFQNEPKGGRTVIYEADDSLSKSSTIPKFLMSKFFDRKMTNKFEIQHDQKDITFQAGKSFANGQKRTATPQYSLKVENKKSAKALTKTMAESRPTVKFLKPHLQVVETTKGSNDKVNEHQDTLSKAFKTMEPKEAIKKHPELAGVYSVQGEAARFALDRKLDNNSAKRLLRSVVDNSIASLAAGKSLPKVNKPGVAQESASR